MSDDRQASSLEFRPLRPAADRYDVAILGGGLAGLTLAIQLKQQRPETSVAVLEKREGPAPEAAFKVGESTVPSGSHYFGHVIDMKEHLESDHLRKCGLRFFFTAGDNSDLTKRFEKGPIFFPPHWDYQIDRGRFETSSPRALARSVSISFRAAGSGRSPSETTCIRSASPRRRPTCRRRPAGSSTRPVGAAC